MTISLCCIAYNEEDTLQGLLDDFLKQDYPKEQTEILLIDSNSADGTKSVMETFCQEYREQYLNIQVLDNPGKILPCGWNVALDHYTGDVVVRVDAHASIPPEFISINVKHLEEGEDVVGGYRPNIIVGETKASKVLLLGESSMFGSSIASYRREGEKSYVDSVFHGAYRREVFEHVGKYNEKLARTEDNEMHYRMRKAGYRLCFCPDIISYQHTRPTLRRMCKQKYANGYWIGLTLGVCPGCISLFHLVPFGFIMGIIITTILAIFHMPILAIIMWGAYWLLAIIMAIMAVVPERKNILQIFLPGLFFLLHISYGIGTLVGLVKMPFFKRKYRSSVKQ